jgi:hypothetical protein
LKENSNEREKGHFIIKKEPDIQLWQKIQAKVAGSTYDKVNAIALIFDNYEIVPDEADKLITEMASKNSPVELRREIANKLVNTPDISWGLYMDVVQILREDEDKEISKKMEPLWEPYRQISENINKYVENFQRQVNPLRDVFASLDTQLDPLRNAIKSLNIYNSLGKIYFPLKLEIPKIVYSLNQSNTEMFRSMKNRAFCPFFTI